MIFHNQIAAAVRRRQSAKGSGMTSTEALLRVEGVDVTISESRVVQAASLTVDPGRIVSLIGPNGAGKTTLVRAALGLQSVSAGSVWRRPKLRVGYVPQKVMVDPSLPITVRRFLSLGAGTNGAAVNSVMNEMGVAKLSDRPVQQVSGGEMQRTLITRALLRDPDLLVLDEPAQGVDISGQEELYRMIGDLRTTRGCGILVVSHDLRLVMAETDHVICLNGYVCCEGQPKSVVDHPAYLEIFGIRHSDALAVYTHNHDYRHRADGDSIRSSADTDKALTVADG